MSARVLVVDDVAVNRRLLEAKLTAEYYEVATAASGAEALAMAARWSPDVILLDVMMPGMDGIEFCRRLKANPGTSDVPVVFITAAPTDLLAARLNTIRYEGLIRKPFTIDEILNTVDRYVGA